VKQAFKEGGIDSRHYKRTDTHAQKDPFILTRRSQEKIREKGQSYTKEETKVDAHQLFEESTGVVILSLFFSFV
jgi:hypothetical protein